MLIQQVLGCTTPISRKTRHYSCCLAKVFALCAMVALAGCVTGGQDISTQIDQVFPFDTGDYFLAGGGSIGRLSKTSAGYWWSGGLRTECLPAKLNTFSLTGSDRYLVQLSGDARALFSSCPGTSQPHKLFTYTIAVASPGKVSILGDWKGADNSRDAKNAALVGKVLLLKQHLSLKQNDWELDAQTAADTVDILKEMIRRGFDFGPSTAEYVTSPDRAIAAYSSGSGSDNSNGLGLALLDKGDLEGALARFSDAVKQSPGSSAESSAHYFRGIAFYRKHDLDRAISELSIGIDGRIDDALYFRGLAYYDKGMFDLAVADYDKLVETQKNANDAFFRRGLAYEAKGDSARAIADYDEALRIGHSDPEAMAALSRVFAEVYHRRGAAHFRRRELALAVADYVEALRLEPNLPGVGRELDQARDLLTPRPDPGNLLAVAQRRVALVIGNSDYQGAMYLGNPTNDADDVSSALRKIGFDVMEGKNLTLEGFAEIAEAYKKKSTGADVSLFYYSGHGMQFEGRDWLVPIDAHFSNATIARSTNLSADELISDFSARAKMTLVFLDACRDNPLANELKAQLRSDTRRYDDKRGLTPIDIKSPETFLVFATTPDHTAADGRGQRNSPFTTAFLRYLVSPGVEVETLMKRVAASVVLETHGEQTPERLSHLQSEFYFVR